MTQREGLLLSGVLLVLVAITLPELGSDPWHFRPPSVDPQGPLAPLVRAAGEEWDLGIPRACCFLAGGPHERRERPRGIDRAGPEVPRIRPQLRQRDRHEREQHADQRPRARGREALAHATARSRDRSAAVR